VCAVPSVVLAFLLCLPDVLVVLVPYVVYYSVLGFACLRQARHAVLAGYSTYLWGIGHGPGQSYANGICL